MVAIPAGKPAKRRRIPIGTFDDDKIEPMRQRQHAGHPIGVIDPPPKHEERFNPVEHGKKIQDFLARFGVIDDGGEGCPGFLHRLKDVAQFGFVEICHG